jgi:hydrogenase maturation protease
MKPVLILGYGNLSRGDDAVAPLCLTQLQATESDCLQCAEFLTDFQLQIEHIFDLQQRELVLFIDASMEHVAPLKFTQLLPQTDYSYTTHAMTPTALMAVYQQTLRDNLPDCFLLTLQQALGFILQLLDNPKLEQWQSYCSNQLS